MRTVKREREKQIKLYVTEEEKAALRDKMSSAGYGNFSAYARTMLLTGKVNQVDFTGLKPLIRELGNLNRNLNQIAKVANTTRDLREEDYQDVLRDWRKAKDLIDRYLYRIIRTDGEAYQPRTEEMTASGSNEDSCD